MSAPEAPAPDRCPAFEILATLRDGDRKLFEDLAARAGVTAEDLLPAMIAAYLRLYRDAPQALPTDPLRGLAAMVRP